MTDQNKIGFDDEIEETFDEEWDRLTQRNKRPLTVVTRTANAELVDEAVIGAMTTGNNLGRGRKQQTANIHAVDPDAKLRPVRLDDIIGQPLVRAMLRRSIRAAQVRGEVLDHVRFDGPAGVGKTTFAQVIAFEMNHRLLQYTGPSLDAPALSSMISKIMNASSEGESCVVFIDELHAVPKETRELLLTLMEDYVIDDLELPPFTLVGATTEPSKLPTPLRHRFGIEFQLDYYSIEELVTIIRRSFKILMGRSQENIDELTADGTPGAKAIEMIAERSRGTPRIANRLVRRVLDYMLDIEADLVVDSSGKPVIRYEDSTLRAEIIQEAMRAMQIDAAGLTRQDREILVAMRKRYNLRPVGLVAIATAIGARPDVVEKVLEPDLVRLGYINRDQRGRTLAAKGITAAELELEGQTIY